MVVTSNIFIQILRMGGFDLDEFQDYLENNNLSRFHIERVIGEYAKLARHNLQGRSKHRA